MPAESGVSRAQLPRGFIINEIEKKKNADRLAKQSVISVASVTDV